MILILSFIGVVLSKIIRKEFVISEENISPDCIQSKTVLINKQFPGPELRARPNDRLIINVKNLLNANFTLHFHGISQKGSSNMDGVEMISQYPIPPNDSFEYDFNVGDQTGTYYYHAHTAFHSLTAFGSLVVEDSNWNNVVQHNKEYMYDEERTIMLSDIFDRNHDELMQGTIDENFKAAVGPRSVLINGQTYLNSSCQNTNKTPRYASGHHIVNVEADKIYRLRLIGASTVSYYKFSIPEHEMTVIEADGVLINPVKTKFLKIHTGQRYSVLIKTNKRPSNYWMHSEILDRKDPMNGNAVLHYEGAQQTAEDFVFSSAPSHQNTPNNQDDPWIYRNLTTSSYYSSTPQQSSNYYPVPLNVNKKFVFDVHSRYIGESIKYAIGNVVFGEPDVLKPVIMDPYQEEKELYTYNGTYYSTLKSPLVDRIEQKETIPGVYKIENNDVVEVVLENYIGEDGNCFEHAWHLHGHRFYEIDFGAGAYSPEKVKLNPNNLILRDTTVNLLNPKKGKYLEACGWKVVRFRANNPGAWLFNDGVNFLRYMGVEAAFVY